MTVRCGRPLAAMFLSAALLAAGGAAAEPTVVGRLTCTAEMAAPQPNAERPKDASGWKLACAYEQNNETASQHYIGDIIGLDQAERAAGKALLVWGVLAAQRPAGALNLVGVYKTTDEEGLPAQALIGGRDQTIILQPIPADGATSSALPSVRLVKLELPRA